MMGAADATAASALDPAHASFRESCPRAGVICIAIVEAISYYLFSIHQVQNMSKSRSSTSIISRQRTPKSAVGRCGLMNCLCGTTRTRKDTIRDVVVNNATNWRSTLCLLLHVACARLGAFLKSWRRGRLLFFCVSCLGHLGTDPSDNS